MEIIYTTGKGNNMNTVKKDYIYKETIEGTLTTTIQLPPTQYLAYLYRTSNILDRTSLMHTQA